MRKILCVCLTVVLCLFATGYAEEAAVDTQELFGKVENGAYENKILGLGFNMDGWDGYDEEHKAIAEKIGEVTGATELLEQLNKTGVVTILDVRADDGTGGININVNDMGSSASIIETIGLDTYLPMIVDTMKEMYSQASMKNIEMEYMKTSIGDQEYAGFNGSYDLLNIHIYMRQMMVARDNYLFTITVSTAKEEAMLDEILGRFYCLKDSEE